LCGRDRDQEQVETQLLTGSLQFVLRDLSTQSIAVDAYHLGGPANFPVSPGKGSTDEASFELLFGVFKANSPRDHFVDETIELIAHGAILG
jgi:hypothetical protein